MRKNIKVMGSDRKVTLCCCKNKCGNAVLKRKGKSENEEKY